PKTKAGGSAGGAVRAGRAPARSPAAALQNRRAPHPTCPVLHPPASREPLDADALSADSRAHRAARVASDVIEKAGHGRREKRSARGGSISRPDGRRGQSCVRWAITRAGAATTAYVMPSERRRAPVARHMVWPRSGRSSWQSQRALPTPKERKMASIKNVVLVHGGFVDGAG